MRFNIVVAAYTLWPIASFGALDITRGSNSGTALEFALMYGAVPCGLQLILLGVDWRGLMAPTKMWVAFLFIVLVSYLTSLTNPYLAPSSPGEGVVPAAWTPIVYTFNVVFMLAIGTVIAGCPDRRLLRSVASLYCILLTPYLIYIDLTGERTWGNRLEADLLQANTWGALGLTVCIAALARKPGPLAFVSFATGIATILAAQSREALLALAVSLLVVGALDWRRMMKRSRLLTVLAGSCATLVIVGVLLDPYVVNAIHYVESDVLWLNDSGRGVNSGFSGRSRIWEWTYNIWLKSPLFGVGYRMHEQFLPYGIPGHDAYLAMLADTGIAGLVWYLGLIIGSLVGSFQINDQRTRRFVAALIVARAISGIFDRITINAGDEYSLFFVICCSVALAEQSLRRAGLALAQQEAVTTPVAYRTRA
jgi:O-antigen ligase